MICMERRFNIPKVKLCRRNGNLGVYPCAALQLTEPSGNICDEIASIIYVIG